MINKKTELPGNQKIKEESVEWIVKLDGDTPPSKQVLNDLEEWMSRSHAHRDAIISMNAFYNDSSLADVFMSPAKETPRFSMVSAFRAFFAMLSKPVLIGAVASVIMVLLLNSAYFIENKNVSPSYAKGNGLFTTNIGQQARNVLSDGTVVLLNTNSELKVEFLKNERRVVLLRGEAHFDVAHDPQKPFSVYSEQGKVQAVGTAFTVNLVKNTLDVLVTEGTVALALPMLKAGTEKFGDALDSSLSVVGLLDAGKHVVLSKDNNLLDNKAKISQASTLTSEGINKLTSWRKGFLLFSGEPLEHVIAEISRFSSIEIKLMDDEVKAIEIGGRFSIVEIDNILKTFEDSFPIKVTRVGYHTYEISMEK
ncbi:FecR family protein [Thalassotalea sp. ND16A]|uniref:FecR family protein n=1 Tax=Thalassotalea sp. ND16A TaxID=1535422 RepID=UPI00051A0D7F|nr:FecR domain-containing protein [Thalassotalea sp. ND16A]KGK00089.1 hypothetical protein ND16A_0280 [Thalassotalea sp. ND16A]